MGKLRWEDTDPARVQDIFTLAERDGLLAYFRARWFENYVSVRLRFEGARPSEVRGFRVGDFDRVTLSMMVRRSEVRGNVGATKTRAAQRPIKIPPDLAADIATICGIRAPEERLLNVAETTLCKRAQTALGYRYRSIYQAKHTYRVLSILRGENPPIVARNLGISLATLEKHYAAALRLMRAETGKLDQELDQNPSAGEKR